MSDPNDLLPLAASAGRRVVIVTASSLTVQSPPDDRHGLHAGPAEGVVCVTHATTAATRSDLFDLR